MLRRLIIACGILGVVGLAVFLFLTQPKTIAEAALSGVSGDVERGKYMFYASGCASCHAAPGAKGDEKLKLAGGHEFKTPFGTFYAPNISPDPKHGIGGWTDLQFVNAVMRGVSPDGSHYYPSFPFMSYQRMKVGDVVDLKAFMDTLPKVTGDAPDHDLPLPFRLRRGLGLWKFLFMDYQPFKADPNASEKLNRGAYLVNGPAHCGECHTPRNFIGGPDSGLLLAGGPAPEGDGVIPNLTPHADGLKSWSETDIAYSLESGFMPDYDSFGGSMVAVQENTAKLTKEDREAIAGYLKSIPAHASTWKKKKAK